MIQITKKLTAMKLATYRDKSTDTLINWYCDLVNVTRNKEQEGLFQFIKCELQLRCFL